MLQEIVDKFEADGFTVEVDPAAQQILERGRRSLEVLQESLETGRQLADNGAQIHQATPGFLRELLGHQHHPVQHLLSIPNAANFSVPGAGKTTIVLAGYQRLRADDAIDLLVVVGPFSSFLAWEEELQSCLGHDRNVVRLLGPREAREEQYVAAAAADLALVTYHTAIRDRERLIRLMRNRRTLLVLDESHYVKGAGATANALLAIAPYAERRVILTGTPMPNGLADLWTQITFLWPEQRVLGNRIQYKRAISTAAGQADVKANLRPLFTRVRKSDLGLPVPEFKAWEVEMTPVQAQIYDVLARRTLIGMNLPAADENELRLWRRGRMVRLLQAATNPSLIAERVREFTIHSRDPRDASLLELVHNYSQFEFLTGKFTTTVGLVDRLVEQGEKVVIWTHFVRNIRNLLDLLAHHGALPLYGAVPRAHPTDESEFTRERHIRAFRTDPAHRVLVANPGAAAESISLHRVCHHAIYLDRSFNAGQYIQSRDRIHRVGLAPDEVVTYHLLKTVGTIDEVVDRRLLDKETAMLAALDDPDIPAVALPVATKDMSGSAEEEAIDFEAVLAHIRERLGER